MPQFRYRLLFIGVNTVPGAPPLHAAARDAEAMSTRFRGWGYDHRSRHVLLLNHDATAARVTDEIQSARSAADLDLLLIYWAGHLHTSGRKHILTTHDEGVEGSATGVGLELLTNAIGLAKGVAHRVLILDACHASPAHPQLKALSRHLSDDECVMVLASGPGDATTREDLRRGYFTGSLLEQMPRDTRGLPPGVDLLAAWRTGAEHFASRRQEPACVGVSAEMELRLPVPSGRGPIESRKHVGRHAAKAISRPSPVALS